MSGAGNRILDFGLLALTTESDRVFLCASDPADYASANATHVGLKSGSRGSMFYAITTPIQGGRMASLAGFLDGDITSNGTANFVVVADSINQNILITEPLAQPQVVKVGGKFAIATLDVILGSSSQPRSSDFTVGSPVIGVPAFSRLQPQTIGITLASPAIGTPTMIATSSGWTNIPEPNQVGAFTLEFDAVPNATGLDNVIGLSNGPATQFTDVACSVYFSLTGSVIQARNGGAYQALAVVNYSGGQQFHIRIFGNITTHTYSAWVTPQSTGVEVQIANNYAFRTEQAAVTQLNNFARNATDIGIVAVSNMAFGALTANPLTVGSPAISLAIINGRANFTAVALSVTSPVLGSNPLKQKYNLTASGGVNPTLTQDFLVTNWSGTNRISNDNLWLKAGVWTADGGTQYDPARAVLSTNDPSGKGDPGAGYLTLQLTTHANPPFGTEVYTNNTVGLYGQGYYEFRALMPGRFAGSAGIVGFFQIQGNFEGVGNFGPNEVDIEFTLNGALSEVTYNLQNTSFAGNPYRQALGFDPSAAYHRYGFLWLADGTIHYYVDGVEVHVLSDSVYIQNTRGTICLNMWCGQAGWGGVGPPTQNEFCYVDYVKYWDGATSANQSSGAALTVSSPVFVAPALVLNSAGGQPAGAFNPQTGTFSIQWDAVPSQIGEDVVTGLCTAAPTSYDEFACTARFAPSGNIDTRNGATYTASATVPYSAGMSFHFRMVVRIASRTFDAYVTPQGQSEILFANNFAFRTEFVGTTLAYLGKKLLVGDVALSNMIGPPPAALTPVVTNATFTPVTSGAGWVAGALIGTMTASNSPTSWAITAGNSLGYFAIANNGNITVTSAGITGLGGTSGSITLTVRATNANGNGLGSAVINYASAASSLFGWQLNASNTGLTGAGVNKSTLPLYTGTDTPLAGTTITLMKIPFVLFLKNGGITLDRCWIQPTDSAGLSSLIFTYNTDNFIGPASPVTIKDCDIDGSIITNPLVYADCAVRGACNVLRCNVFGMGSGITVYDSENGAVPTVLIENNYVHGLRGGIYSGQQSHNEAASMRSFKSSSCIWRNNYILSDSSLRGGADSAGMFIQANGEIKNVTLVGNYIECAGFWDLALEYNSGGYSNMSADNNRFFKDSDTNPHYVDGGPGWASWTNNYVYNGSAPPDYKGAVVTS